MTVTLERTETVAVVRLNRPDSMNAMNVSMRESLFCVLSSVAEDDSVRCVVLSGVGRAFSVGQDLKEHASLMEREGEEFDLGRIVVEQYNPIVKLLATMDKPVIAAVNGIAAGAGASFALAADLRIFAETGGLNTAFTGIGLSCDSGVSFTLPQIVGTAKAKDLLFRPRTVQAAECLELGLATEVVPEPEFEARVRALAIQLGAGPTKAYGAVRKAIAYSSGHSLVEALIHEAELMTSTGASLDHRNAVHAFLAKEDLVFKGG